MTEPSGSSTPSAPATPKTANAPSSKLTAHPIWDWAGKEVQDVAEITREHGERVYMFDNAKYKPMCPDLMQIEAESFVKMQHLNEVQKEFDALPEDAADKIKDQLQKQLRQLNQDIEKLRKSLTSQKQRCSRSCVGDGIKKQGNMNCLNLLGQERWQNRENALYEYLDARNIRGNDPSSETRMNGLPVGLEVRKIIKHLVPHPVVEFGRYMLLECVFANMVS
jgi:septal ring factor EnvC (AmiA/AmiB activator)